MTEVDLATVAAVCARTISKAMRDLPSGTALEARADGARVVITMTSTDEDGALIEVREAPLADGLLTAAARASAARLEAFVAASARWLAAQPASGREGLYPHDVLVPAVLADARLESVDDFAAVLADPARRVVYVARSELGDFFARHGLAAPDDDEALRALHALTPEGRASAGLAASVRAIGSLVMTAWGQRALVMMMHEWASEPHDPWEVAWDGGPIVAQLLITGAWRSLDPVLVDAGLRRRALDAFDRLPHPVGPGELARAGF